MRASGAAHTGGLGAQFGEIALWTAAGLLVLTAHIAAAALLLKQDPAAPAESAPPAAIMIELAPEPEAAKTEEEQIATDAADARQVESEQTQPVEQAQPEPEPQPVPEPSPEPVEPPPPQEVAEAPEPAPAEPAPEPVQEPPPETPPVPEMTQTIPEPPPEPADEPDPLEEQMTAALDDVEVPLPMMRPAPPRPQVAEMAESRKETEKVDRRKQRQQQAQKEMAEAKVEAKQSDRTAANQTSTGSLFSSSVSPTRWMTQVRAKIARHARRCPNNAKGIVTVRFSFDDSGNIGSVSVARSSGDAAIDDYVTSAVRRASPIPAPPSGVASSLSQPVQCE